MFEIDCPWCGLRDEAEFHCTGEAHIIRPEDPYALSDEEWVDYLHHRTNPKGVHFEQWQHTHGCRRWFNVARNTVTNEILAVYQIGEPKPNLTKDEVKA